MRTRIVLFYFFLVTFAFMRSAFSQARPAWEVEWERIVQAANKEGQVNVYMWGNTAVLDEGLFQAAHPRVRVTVVSGRGGQLLQRILAERRAGKFIADVYIDGLGNIYPAYLAKTLEPIKAVLLLPEVSDESRWWQGRHHYTDREASYLFRFQSTAMKGMIAYHNRLVNPKTFSSFWDFLRPQWKGKMEARDVREAGPGSAAMRFFYHNPDLGPNFISRLFGEMDVALFRDNRLAVDWLGSGKYAICFFCNEVDAARRQGLLVDTFKEVMREGAGLYQQAGTITLVNRSPHPSAAKLFINWFLSREGQYALQKASARAQGSAGDSLRVDIPKDYVLPEDRREEGVKYMDMDTPERMDIRPVIKIFSEALAKGEKK